MSGGSHRGPNAGNVGRLLHQNTRGVCFRLTQTGLNCHQGPSLCGKKYNFAQKNYACRRGEGGILTLTIQQMRTSKRWWLMRCFNITLFTIGIKIWYCEREISRPIILHMNTNFHYTAKIYYDIKHTTLLKN